MNLDQPWYSLSNLGDRETFPKKLFSCDFCEIWTHYHIYIDENDLSAVQLLKSNRAAHQIMFYIGMSNTAPEYGSMIWSKEP